MATSSNHVVAADHNFFLYKGDTWADKITITDSLGAAIDLAGAEILMQLKKNAAAEVVELELTNGAGITVSGTGNNEINILIDIEIAAGNYKYDLQVVKDGVTTTYLKGEVSIKQDVSR